MSDPQALIDAMTALEAAVAALPKVLDDPAGLVSTVRVVRGEVALLQRETERREEDAGKFVDAAEESLSGLGQDAETLEGQLTEAAAALVAKVDEHEVKAQERLQALAAAVEQAGAAMNHLQASLVAAGQEAQAAEAQVSEASVALAETARAAQHDLESAAGEVEREMEVLDTETQRAAADLATDLQALAETMAAAAARGRDRLADALTNLTAVTNAHSDAAQAAAARVTQGRADLRARVEQAILGAVVTKLGGKAREAAQALRSLDDAAGQAAARTDATDGRLGGGLDAMLNETTHLIEGIAAVVEAAGRVGLTF